MDSSIKNKLPLVSVVIPNYNYGEYLPETIESVLGQNYPNIELIVVDDESSDDSVKILKSYGNDLTLIQQKNAGVSAARNLGLRFVSGEYVCFLDSDDSWEPDKVSLQMSKFIHNEVGVVYSSVNLCDAMLSKIGVWPAIYRGDIRHLYFRFPTRAIVPLCCSNAMIRTHVIRSVGEFDTDLNTSADWDFFRRVSEITQVEFIDAPLVNYRQHSRSMSSGSLVKYYLDNELAVTKFVQDILNRDYPISRRYSSTLIWTKFQISAFYALLMNRKFNAAFHHLSQLFRTTYSQIR
jgi:glycosyltransferase involved in cell wall biosynthesis